MILAQLETVTNIVEKASSKDDRYLFLLALAIIMVGGAICIRWLVNTQQKRDITNEVAAGAMRLAHEKERNEWREVMQSSKSEFLTALDKQTGAFRAELSEERHQCAQERILDREARHTMANALNAVGLALHEQKEAFSNFNKAST